MKNTKKDLDNMMLTEDNLILNKYYLEEKEFLNKYLEENPDILNVRNDDSIIKKQEDLDFYKRYDIFNDFIQNVETKNGIIYYNIKNKSYELKIGIEDSYKCLICEDLYNNLIINNESIIGFCDLSNTDYKGKAELSGCINGTGVNDENIKNIKIYNNDFGKIKGIIPIKTSNSIKYICIFNRKKDFYYWSYKIPFFLIASGLVIYKIYRLFTY